MPFSLTSVLPWLLIGGGGLVAATAAAASPPPLRRRDVATAATTSPSAILKGNVKPSLMVAAPSQSRKPFRFTPSPKYAGEVVDAALLATHHDVSEGVLVDGINRIEAKIANNQATVTDLYDFARAMLVGQAVRGIDRMATQSGDTPDTVKARGWVLDMATAQIVDPRLNPSLTTAQLKAQAHKFARDVLNAPRCGQFDAAHGRTWAQLIGRPYTAPNTSERVRAGICAQRIAEADKHARAALASNNLTEIGYHLRQAFGYRVVHWPGGPAPSPTLDPAASAFLILVLGVVTVGTGGLAAGAAAAVAAKASGFGPD